MAEQQADSARAAQIEAILRWQWEGLHHPFDGASPMMLKLWRQAEQFANRLLEPFLIETQSERVQEELIQHSTEAAAGAFRDALIVELAARLAIRTDVHLPAVTQ